MADSHPTNRPYDPFAGGPTSTSTSSRSSSLIGIAGLGAPGPGPLQLPPLGIGVQPRTSHQRSSIDFSPDRHIHSNGHSYGHGNGNGNGYSQQSRFRPSPFLMNTSPDDSRGPAAAGSSGSSSSNAIGTIHGSPQSMYMSLPRRSSDMSDAEDSEKKRKRSSLVSLDQGEGFVARRAVTLGHADGLAGNTTAGSETEEEATPETKKGQKRAATTVPPTMTSSGMPLLTSCEACRKGKRRCEPSPLVPPDHPDIARLPCARCRRFALECVRVKVNRRKGPAPVDLSAISDAVHGFQNGSGSGSGDYSHMGDMPAPPLPPDPMRRGTVIQPHDPTMSGMLDQGAVPMYPPNPGKYATSPSFPLLAASPSLSISALPENLDHVVSGPVIDNIINLFFDYVYPLTPCLHRPTFIANLTARMDKTDPIFFALTLNVIASTLVQVPRSLVNLEKSEVESLARRCVRVAKAKINFVWEDPVPVQSAFVVISYLEGIVHLLLGNNTAHVVATAQANQLALAMRLNEEPSYAGLDPVEGEIRRRIYWLLFQADKSTACLRARTICLRLDDAPGLLLPTEVDDEQITPAGIMPQPIGKTPLISGFNIVTNLFRILNDALILHRRKVPPTVDTILADLKSVNELRQRVMQTTVDVATPFQLRKAYDSRLSSPAHDWETKLETRFLDYFQSAGDTTHALNSFLVMQGNILVTQHVVRLVLLQTRESLYQQLAMLTQLPLNGMGVLTGAQQTAEAAEDIACELLDGLNSLPVECVATNGPSLVQKVRFVAIQLMEYSPEPSPTTLRANKLLMQFLSVLSVIEGMYTFGRDISSE